MSNKQNPAPLVKFAQKATAIVKAAGFDPKTIDLETFRRLAPIIFTRAYCAIYKEQLIYDINEYSNREEQILNSQLVIDGLTAKTRNPALATVSGIDIFQGNHRAVGILAGALFAEGQRLWMEKMNAPPVKTSPDIKDRDSPQKPDSEAEEIDHDEERIQLEMIKNSSNIPPHELEKLLNRIAYLEERLKKRTRRSKSRSKSPPNRRGDNPNNRSRDHRSRSPEARTQQEQEQQQQYPFRTSATKRDFVDNASDISEDDGDSMGDNGSEPALPRPKSRSSKRRIRPSSAPSRRRVREVSHRLYSAPLNKQVMEFAHQQVPPKQPKPPMANPLYTYDLTSGRRILVTQAEHDRELREQAKKTLGNLNHITKDEDDFMGGGLDSQHKLNVNGRPSHPEYPCKRIETSAEEWVKKNRLIAAVDKPVAEMPSAKPLFFYQQMNQLDIVFSIEHCHNCEHHQITTRHNPLEYKKNADEFLRILAQCAMQSGLCMRVGVARFEADITCKSRMTDENSRIGAFEVQIACKNERGELSMGLLHSKLFSGRWPSKSVLEKRFHTFMAKFPSLPTYAYSADGVTDYSMEISADGQNYPIGRCTFTDTALADPFWSFTSFQASSSASVMWVFDTRSLQHMAKFSLQSMVLVNNVTYQPGCVEKYPLIGVVKRYEDNGNNHSNSRHLYVQLKYHQSDSRVLESDCIPYDEHHPLLKKPLAGDAGKLPLDLEGLLMLGQRENLLQWQMSDEEDRIVVNGTALELSLKSLYHQLRKLAWQLAAKLPSKPLLHPLLGRVIDTQLCYSERMMSKLLEMFGSHVNMQVLERYLPVDPKLLPAVIAKSSKPVASFENVNANATSSNNNNNSSQINGTSSPRASPQLGTGNNSSNTPIAIGQKSSSASSPAAFTMGSPSGSAKPADSSNIPANIGRSSPGATTSAAVASTTSRKPGRPSVSTKPPIQNLRELDERFRRLIQLPLGKPSNCNAIEMLVGDVQGTVAQYETSTPSVKLEDLIRLLYEYSLEAVANSAQDMKVLVSYLAPEEDDDGMSSELALDKLFEWLRGHFVYPTEISDLTEPTAVTSESSSAPSVANDTTTGIKSSSVISGQAQQSPQQNKALLQLPLGAATGLTPISSRRPAANLASIPEASSHLNPEGVTANENEANDEKVEEAATDGAPTQESPQTDAFTPVNTPYVVASKAEETNAVSEPSTNNAVDCAAPNNNRSSSTSPTAKASRGNSFTTSSNSPRTLNSAVNYQNKDVVISSIVLEGTALQNPAYDSVFLMFDVENGLHLEANVCMAREKGSKQRTFNVTSANWMDIPFSAMQFRERHIYLSIVVAENVLLQQQFPNIPTASSTLLGFTANSIAIPAHVFAQPSFTITATVHIPFLPNTVTTGSSSVTTPSSVSAVSPSAFAGNSNGGTSSNNQDEGKITITIHGLSREGKEARMTRILSMKPVDLLKLKFEPVALDDYDDDSDGYDSDTTSLLSKKSLSKHKNKHEKSREGLEFNDESLNQTLFPDASYGNLLSLSKGLSTNPSGATLPAADA